MPLKRVEQASLSFLIALAALFLIPYFQSESFSMPKKRGVIAVEVTSEGKNGYLEVPRSTKSDAIAPSVWHRKIRSKGSRLKDGERIYFEKAEITVSVRSGKKILWEGKAPKGISASELLESVHIDPDRASTKEKERILSRNGAVVHISD